MLIIIWVVYCILLFAVYGNWLTLKARDDLPPGSALPAISVVIAMRNESQNLPVLLQSLLHQDYPRDLLEIIAVNDHSQDATAAMLEGYAQQFPANFKYKHLQDPPNFQGSFKKRALTEGIALAGNPVIVTTDADCRFPRKWLSTLVGYLHNQKAEMVCGPVSLAGPQRGLPALGEIEQAALVAVGASFLKWGYPNMCNGANLAFTKAAFQEVGGYGGFEAVISGDDEFLLYKIHQRYPRAVHFLRHPSAVVQTLAPESLRAWYHQRKRWSSKWRHHRSASTKGLALLIYFFHVSWLIAGALTIAGIYPWYWWGTQALVKLLAEYFLVVSVLSLFAKSISWGWFLTGQFVYSFYAVILGVAANIGGFQWKNRRYT